MKEKEFSWSEVANKAVYGVNSFQTSGYAVDPGDLESLQNALDRWGQFLRNVFLGSTKRYISKKRADKLAMEDTELYLDVKIQLSQILSPIQDDMLANRLEMVCNDIRKDSYQFLTTSLLALNDNSRRMEESRDQAGLMESPGNRSNSTGNREQNDMAVRHKQIMLTINRQHRDVIQNLAQLNNRIANSLYPEEFEL